MWLLTLKIGSYKALHDEAERVALESHDESTVLLFVIKFFSVDTDHI